MSEVGLGSSLGDFPAHLFHIPQFFSQQIELARVPEFRLRSGDSRRSLNPQGQWNVGRILSKIVEEQKSYS
jgi:hypothetical protein